MGVSGGKMRRISLKNCPYCGSSKVYASSSATLWQKFSVLFLLRLVRCHHCMRRHFQPIFLPAARAPTKPTIRQRSVPPDAGRRVTLWPRWVPHFSPLLREMGRGAPYSLSRVMRNYEIAHASLDEPQGLKPGDTGSETARLKSCPPTRLFVPNTGQKTKPLTLACGSRPKGAQTGQASSRAPVLAKDGRGGKPGFSGLAIAAGRIPP